MLRCPWRWGVLGDPAIRKGRLIYWYNARRVPRCSIFTSAFGAVQSCAHAEINSCRSRTSTEHRRAAAADGYRRRLSANSCWITTNRNPATQDRGGSIAEGRGGRLGQRQETASSNIAPVGRRYTPSRPFHRRSQLFFSMPHESGRFIKRSWISSVVCRAMKSSFSCRPPRISKEKMTTRCRQEKEACSAGEGAEGREGGAGPPCYSN